MKYFLILALSILCSSAQAQRNVPATNEFKVTGDIKAERTFRISDIEKYRQADLGDISIKNHKGEEKSLIHKVKGVLLKSILDSVGISIDKPKELSEYYFIFIASDGYKNVYSWNEIFNSPIGDKLYILTGKDGKGMAEMDGHILVLSMADFNTGSRYLKGLATIEVKRVK